MRRRVIIIIGVCLIGIILFNYFKNHSTLERYLNHKFSNSKIIIHYRDVEKRVILFSEGTETSRQYVLYKFNRKYGVFYDFNDNSNQGGVRIGSPYMVTISNRTSVGNIIWGVFNTKEHITKAEIRFFNDNNMTFTIDPNMIDNAFVYYPCDLYRTTNFFKTYWRYDIKAFDNTGNIIINEKNQNIPGVF